MAMLAHFIFLEHKLERLSSPYSGLFIRGNSVSKLVARNSLEKVKRIEH